MADPLAVTDWTHFCCRCQSEIGWNDAKPDFCEVCWEDRVRVPAALVERLEQEGRERRRAEADLAACRMGHGEARERLEQAEAALRWYSLDKRIGYKARDYFRASIPKEEA